MQVQVPPNAVARARRRLVGERNPSAAASESGFAAVRPPRVEVARRDPQRALDFLRDPALEGDGESPSAALTEFFRREAASQGAARTLAERVASVSWYHTIELPEGVVTPGWRDHRRLVPHIGLPADMTGMRALDVATYDGFWAFEMERRGAEVTAIDLPSTGSLDLPSGAGEIVANEGLDVPFGVPFALAKEALGSSVRRLERSVYDLDPDEVGTFDVVFLGDLLLHLRNPLEALRRVRSVTSGRLIVADRYDPDLTGTGQSLVRYEGGWNAIVWWNPSLEALVQMVADSGFGRTEVAGCYRLVATAAGSPLGWHRAVIHAWP